MLDLQLLRENPQFVAGQLARRGIVFDTARYQALEAERKRLQVSTEQLQSERNQCSKAIGQAKANGESIQPLQDKVARFAEQLEQDKKALELVQSDLAALIESLPNLPHVSVPEGKSVEDNVEIRRWGTPKTFSFIPKSHDELGEALGQMDFALAAKITGARFVVMKRSIARLHRALTQWMLDLHITEHAYEELYVPYMVNRESLYGTGQLPKMEEDLFKLSGENGYYLIPTGEVPVTNVMRDTIVHPESLPLRFVTHTPCFRSEAGSYGKDTKGMIRQHQFEKVELVWITEPEQSYEALEQLVGHAEVILQRLELPYRVVNLCAGDLGNAAKTYDLEVWLPSQNTYREISSCSNFEAYQSRRMQARYRDIQSNKPKYAHTLNGSGLAIGRTLVAILENYQDEAGNITIPDMLQPYMAGMKKIFL